MLINIPEALSFILITNITPGPNNISSAQTGLNVGYRHSLPYLFGIITGVFSLLLFGAFAASAILTIFPSLQKLFSLGGAIYILYLAWKTLGSDYSFNEKVVTKPLTYVNGLLLQLMNPKAIVYALTLFSSVIPELHGQVLYLILVSIFSVLITFLSVSVWTLGGAAIRNFMQNDNIKRIVNIVLSLLLVVTAVQIILSGF